MSPVLVAEPPCADCDYTKAAWSDRIGRNVCGRCYFASIPKAEREASDGAWARRDLATQIRGVANRLPASDPRRQRLRDLAFDFEMAGSDRAAAPVFADLRAAGVALAVR